LAALVGKGLAFSLVPVNERILTVKQFIKPQIVEMGRWTIISTLRLVVFVPFFMLNNAQSRHHLPLLRPHDYHQ
jgi:hypothetical protein